MKCTFKELELQNGEVIKLTLNFSRLLQLKNKRKKDYELYNNVLGGKEKDNLLGTLIIVYTAYLCANIDKLDDDNNSLMSREEFIDAIPNSFGLINDIAVELTNPKQKKISDKPSEMQQEKLIVVK